VVPFVVLLCTFGCVQDDESAALKRQKEEFGAQILRAHIRYVQSTGVSLEELGITLRTDPAGATCTADCAGGSGVTCEGTNCGANDGVGCSSWDSNGKTVQSKLCVTSTPPPG
jgi:hypothetical protein